MCSTRRHLLCALLVLFLTVPTSVSALGATPEPGAKVFILRMKNGFDLHLTNRLIQAGWMTVVTDPQDAEYVLTENVGPGFEEVLKELFRNPEEEEEQPPPSEQAKENEKAEMPVLNRYAGARPSTFGKAGGVVFLVKRVDSSVIWSTFLERRDNRDQAMDKHAGNVVKRLGRWLEKERQGLASD
jgi:hypothetical protein